MKFIKKNIYIIGAFAFLVIALAVSGLVIYFNRDVQDSDSTAIGHIYLGNMSVDERKTAIQDGIDEWKDNLRDSEGYVITYQNMTMHFFIDEYIYYNEELTINNIEEGSDNNKAFMFPNVSGDQMRLVDLENKINNYFFGEMPVAKRPQVNFGDWNQYSSLKEGNFWYDVLTVAGQFYSSYEFDLYDYLTTIRGGQYVEVAKEKINTEGYEEQVANIVEELDKLGKVSHKSLSYDVTSDEFIEKTTEYTGIKVENGEKDQDGFSLLDYTKNTDLDSRELSILGTGITALAMQSNFTNIRRTSDREMPSYSCYGIASTTLVDEVDSEDEYGVATKISRPNSQDLTFYNSDSYDYNIKIETNEDKSELTFTLLGTHSVRDSVITQVVTTKNFNVAATINQGMENYTNAVEYQDACDEYIDLGYIDMTDDADFLAAMGVTSLPRNSKVLYLETTGANGAEVSFYRTYTITTEEKVYDEKGKFTGEFITKKEEVTEKILKDAAYPASAQEGTYVIVALEVEEI